MTTPRSGARRRLHVAGRARPGRDHDRHAPRAARPQGCRAGRRAGRVPAQPGAGRRARRARSWRAAPRSDRAVLIEVPADELVRRLSGRWICRKEGHVYHERKHPPRKDGVCDIDGSALYQRDDDRPETIRARLAQQLGALGDVIAYYRERGVLGTVDGTVSVPEVTAALVAQVSAVPKGA